MENTNKRFGRLESGNVLTYAPATFKVESGIIINPPQQMYTDRGWYVIIDEMPESEEGFNVQFKGYSQDDTNKTIMFEYVKVPVPITREVFTYSKLRLEQCLFQMNKLQEFDDFLDRTFIENDLGAKVAIRRFYDQAQELKSDNEYFETYSTMAKQFMGLDDEQFDNILEKSKII